METQSEHFESRITENTLDQLEAGEIIEFRFDGTTDTEARMYYGVYIKAEDQKIMFLTVLPLGDNDSCVYFNRRRLADAGIKPGNKGNNCTTHRTGKILNHSTIIEVLLPELGFDDNHLGALVAFTKAKHELLKRQSLS